MVSVQLNLTHWKDTFWLSLIELTVRNCLGMWESSTLMFPFVSVLCAKDYSKYVHSNIAL